MNAVRTVSIALVKEGEDIGDVPAPVRPFPLPVPDSKQHITVILPPSDTFPVNPRERDFTGGIHRWLSRSCVRSPPQAIERTILLPYVPRVKLVRATLPRTRSSDTRKRYATYRHRHTIQDVSANTVSVWCSVVLAPTLSVHQPTHPPSVAALQMMRDVR